MLKMCYIPHPSTQPSPEPLLDLATVTTAEGCTRSYSLYQVADLGGPEYY